MSEAAGENAEPKENAREVNGAAEEPEDVNWYDPYTCLFGPVGSDDVIIV